MDRPRWRKIESKWFALVRDPSVWWCSWATKSFTSTDSIERTKLTTIYWSYLFNYVADSMNQIPLVDSKVINKWERKKKMDKFINWVCQRTWVYGITSWRNCFWNKWQMEKHFRNVQCTWIERKLARSMSTFIRTAVHLSRGQFCDSIGLARFHFAHMFWHILSLIFYKSSFSCFMFLVVVFFYFGFYFKCFSYPLK